MNEDANSVEQKLIDGNVDDRPIHHIVKRKSKGGRGFGFGRKKPSGSRPKPSSNRDPYPKQPGHNPYPKQPAYNPTYGGGSAPNAPPPYPGMNNRPGGNSMGAPPPYPGTNNHYPMGAPPPYSATGHHNMPSYPSGGYGHTGYGGFPSGGGGNVFGGRGFGGGKYGGGGLGRTIGSAGFGAIAGTALGAYGGYKLGKMVGGLGRHGHYGYYDDHGKYMRCEPPKNIKFDPETNITYIPIEEDYDKRCSYFDRQPPPQYMGYTNGAGFSITYSPINKIIGSILDLTFVNNYHLLWNNVFFVVILSAIFAR